MTPERWARVKDLFHRAVALPAAERDAFLMEHCGRDEAPGDLRAEIDRLLAAHTRAGGFIEQSPVSGPDGVSLLERTIAPMTGRTIGRYAVERLIGAGGMGQVYAATDRELGRTVALKVAFGSDEASSSRLRREAQHASRLNHPHICTIHEVGTVDGQPFIVMELVEGRRLADAIPEDGLPIAEVVRYGQQVADALAHAHHAGVTHGDLKSANVIVTPEGRVKVLDFGLSRRSSQEVRDLSQSQTSADGGVVAGTLAYMAPELLRGEAPDPTSDVWALGVLLHHLAAGTHPFSGATGFELSGAILHQPPAPLPARVPGALGAVIQRCLAKERAARFQSAGDVHSVLATVDVAGASEFKPAPSAASTHRWFAGNWGMRAAVALIVVALGFGAYRLARPADDTSALPGAAGVSTSSEEASRLYAQGIEANRNFRARDAERTLTQAVTIDPAFGQAYLALAFAVADQGRAQEAADYLRKAAQYQDRLSDRERMVLQTELARSKGDFAEAANTLDRLIGTYPDVEAAYVIGIQLYHSVAGPLANLDKMLAVGKAGADALPLSPVTRNLYGLALFIAGRYVEALREFEAYARLLPGEPEPHLGLSRTYVMMGLPDKAVDAAGRALEIDSGSGPARELRAWALATMGRFNEAAAQSAPASVFNVVLLTGAGRYRDADQHAANLLRDAETRGNTAAAAGLGIIHCRAIADRGHYKQAVETCREAATSARQMTAGSGRTFLVIADSLSGVAEARLGQLDRAGAHLASLTRAHRPAVPLEHWLSKALEGEIALARGELQKAERAFTEGEPPVRAFGFGTGMANNPPFTDGLARIAEAKGDLSGAIGRYRDLLTQSAEHKWQALPQPGYVLQLARLLERTGDRQAARQEYERFLEIWSQADADLPELAEARAALARLR